MILLVTSAQRAPEFAQRLSEAVGETVVVAQTFLEATSRLRVASCSLVVFDQNLLEAEPHEAATALAHLGDAVPVDINFALTGIDRLIGHVQSALLRRERTQAAAGVAAARALHSELNATITELLLDCGLALKIPDLPPAAAERLAFIRASAERLFRDLETAASIGA